MSIANCARCGKMYQKAPGRRICNDCIAAEEEAFRAVYDFLEQNPGADMAALTEGTGVDPSVIRRFLKGGRLAKLGDLVSGLAMECQRCGQPGTTGRYCQPCTLELEEAFKSSSQTLSEAPEAPSRLRRPETLEEKRGGDSSPRRFRR